MPNLNAYRIYRLAMRLFIIEPFSAKSISNNSMFADLKMSTKIVSPKNLFREGIATPKEIFDVCIK